ncbi:unnamed protein product [Protopolystoma xenopodis]|uniref:Uncharacterized protein n=1 Tax=Protopolystoma xenopodis TaxID=117903 RepID=A0A448X3C8_9PLAT|nr:unnamed protein product [Protopolystoma xenopodis]
MRKSENDTDVKFSTDLDESKKDSNFGDRWALLPPPNDLETAKCSADFIVDCTRRFSSDTSPHVTVEWVKAMENLTEHLPIGLAHLYIHDKDAYEVSSTCLVTWLISGLDLSLALQHADVVHVSRHLSASVRLAGLLLSAAAPTELANSLLFSSSSNNYLDCQSQKLRPSAFQVGI